MLKISNLKKYLFALAAFASLLTNDAFAHGIGFTNTRIVMDPASIATLINRPIPGITPTDNVGFIISVDTALLSGPVGYFTLYNPVGATVTNAEFVNSAYSNISAAAPTAMEDGWGARVDYDFKRDWTVGINSGLMFSGGFKSRQTALGAELGYLAMQNLWVSVGYNVFGFRDDELAGEDYTNEGLFLRMRYKFDESVLK